MPMQFKEELPPPAHAAGEGLFLRKFPPAGSAGSMHLSSPRPLLLFFSNSWGKVAIGGETPVSLAPGSFLALAPLVSAEIRWRPAENDTDPPGYLLEFPEELIHQTAQLMRERYPALNLAPTYFLQDLFASIENAATRDSFRRLIHTCFHRVSSWQVLADLQLQELLVLLLESPARNLFLYAGAAWVRSRRMASAIQFIHENLHHSFTLSETARYACLSEASLYRIFRQELGICPSQYITRERIRRARMLLAQMNHSIAEVADICGFSSSAYFIKTFRFSEGITPRQYQKKALEERSFSWNTA